MIIIDKIPNDKNIKNIFFDIDGTITRWKSVEQFLKAAMEKIGASYSKEALIGLFEAMKERELHALITSEADENIYSALLDYNIPTLQDYGVNGHDLKDAMFEMEADATFISDDVIDEMARLAEMYNLYAYTNWFKKQAIKKLDKYNLTGYFEAIHSPEDTFVKYPKEGFVHLLYRYNLSPSEVVHIGDSENDIMPASSAGLYTIYLNYGIASSDDLTEDIWPLIKTADASITEFKDIRRVLTKRD